MEILNLLKLLLVPTRLHFAWSLMADDVNLHPAAGWLLWHPASTQLLPRGHYPAAPHPHPHALMALRMHVLRRTRWSSVASLQPSSRPSSVALVHACMHSASSRPNSEQLSVSAFGLRSSPGQNWATSMHACGEERRCFFLSRCCVMVRWWELRGVLRTNARRSVIVDGCGSGTIDDETKRGARASTKKPSRGGHPGISSPPRNEGGRWRALLFLTTPLCVTYARLWLAREWWWRWWSCQYLLFLYTKSWGQFPFACIYKGIRQFCICDPGDYSNDMMFTHQRTKYWTSSACTYMPLAPDKLQ